MHGIHEGKSTKTKRRSLGNYEVHLAWEGFASIQQISSGEIMHSRTPPMEEARRLYVEQSNLVERVRLSAEENAQRAPPLILWDVGLGAAANTMAAILCYEEAAIKGPVRPLRIVSFENDLDSLRLALRYIDDFPYLRHSGPAAIVQHGVWQSVQHAGLSWLLLLGDFIEKISTAPAPPDLIYYDMFSSKASGEPWRLATFGKLFEACAGHTTELFTYTCSTANRAGLLAAGFHVARGRNAGEKVETTIALTPAACGTAPSSFRRDLLTRDWLDKWNRSRAKFPDEISADQRDSFEQLIRSHPQFRDR